MESPHPGSGLSPASPGLPAPRTDEIQRIAPDLIETMRLEQGRIVLWPGHRARLRASARVLGYPLDEVALDGWLDAQIKRLTHEQSWTADAGGTSLQPAAFKTDRPPTGPLYRLRLLLTAHGRLSLEAAPLPPSSEPVRLALATEALGPDATLDADDPWLRYKTTHRPRFAAAQAWLQAHPGHFDLVFGNLTGDLCEGSRCTLYVKDADGTWLTPPLANGLLPGVRRQTLLDAGAVREARLSLDDLRGAPALRISNALRGWLDARLIQRIPE